MLRLRTLGGLSIENAAAIGGATGNRRPLALLALLAVAGRRGLSRDKIVALLWPESDAEHGRNSLSQVISLLRRELASDDVLLGTAELRVNADVLSCDVIEFEQRIATDDLDAATQLYTGPFLDGVFLKSSPEFERWVDQERSRLEQVQGDALELLAARAGAGGDHVTAVRLWRRRASLTPSDSRVARKVMESLVSSGDRAGALAHYRAHDAVLRDDIGVEPDAAFVAYVAGVRRGISRSAEVPNVFSSKTEPSTDATAVAGAQPPRDGWPRDEPAAVARGNATAARRAGWIIAAVVAVALITAAVTRETMRSGKQVPVSRLSALLPDGTALHRTGVALSPDGKTIVYAAVTEGTLDSPSRLYVQRLDELHARPLAKTEGATYPFFSPDGASVGFTAGGKLKTISLTNDSTETVIADSLRLGFEEGTDASWGEDGYIVFGENSDDPTLGIRRVSARGGPVRVLSRPERARGDASHFAPQQLPGTKTLIFSIRSRDNRGAPAPTYRVVAQPLYGGPLRTVIEGATRARYIGDGWLAYQTGGDVFVARFDVRTLALSERRHVLSGVFSERRAHPWAATADVFIYQPEPSSMRTLVWVSRDGTRDTLAAPPGNYESPTISPSGDRVALLVRDSTRTDLWTYDLRRSGLNRVSSDGITGSPIIWSSDGRRLTYRRRTGTGLDVYSRAADGTGAPELLFGNGGSLWPAAWTRDMRTLVVMQHDTVTNGGDLWALDIASKTLRPLVRTPAQEWGGRVSPDGRWLAYFSDVSNQYELYELYVTPFPGAGKRWQVSHDGASEAVWSKDGRELFFRSGRKVLVAAVRPGATFDWDQPRVLFEGDYFQRGPGGANYDVSSDGKRFLMLHEPPRGAPHLNVIQGWLLPGIDNAAPNR